MVQTVKCSPNSIVCFTNKATPLNCQLEYGVAIYGVSPKKAAKKLSSNKLQGQLL